ncbi:phospholipase A1 PLIP1, chloroplastic-like [Papaver somniferum]|uniref:phospholipase A1 PLIP1, chloroplastic-like n=1 Tax=Papaver somniferum TaxID=3469 RepID=UPI000E7040CF|nr:phospholipase A1 PLIP1, chloroplastic-like [Papaver somniferum]XP_026425043.1 phospholipase A1 PLIP1, chloroplastic-like [Papaver somniferum]
MGCTSMSISTSHIAAATKDIYKEHNNKCNLRRSNSNMEICQRASLRRSHSDPQLRYSIRATSTESKLKTSKSSVGIFHQFQISSSLLPNKVRSLLFETDKMKLVEHHEREEVEEHEHLHEEEEREQEKRANWVERLLELRSQWKNRQSYDQIIEEEEDDYDHVGGCEANYDSEFEEEEVEFDRETFSKLLTRVPWSDTKLYSQLAFLCNMAYVIPEIKAQDLRKYYNLYFVTSSLEKKAEAALKVKLDQGSAFTDMPISSSLLIEEEVLAAYEQPKRLARPSVAYNIAASAATYIHSRAKGLLSLGYNPPSMDEDAEVERRIMMREEYGGECSPRVYKKPEVAAYVAASTMTTVVAAEENVKQEAANELQSLHSSPCEWFICDDPSTFTRCFIIQGSDSLASWQANLFFEPTKFEGTDVLVHRGIYEAAKGIYEQFMPEILNHLRTYGDFAKVRFIGHSLGGSLSLLVNLMLLSRGVLESSTLLPVVTFGSPSVFCGGVRILKELGLDENHVHSVMMHRDIVPRAFSCNYPNHVAQVLKRLNGTFRSHPCLNKNKMLYTPLGQLFILQPDEKLSPSHPLLPPGGALYALDKTQCGSHLGIKSALKAFLNSPHPLETLSDPTAYGSEGTILRDHDSSNYLKAMNGVLRQRTKLVVRKSRKERLHHLWPLLTTSQSWRHRQHLESPDLIPKEVISGA